MAKTDLNIIERGIKGSTWAAQETGLTAGDLDKVIEQQTNNSTALNSLPTPFARFFVAREAFRRAKEEHINPNNKAGFSYRQIVSDILDVYELIFNIKYHRNSWGESRKLEVREWEHQPNLNRLKDKMPILHNSIANYYETDIKEDKLYFIVYTEEGKSILLACSSPYTGFVTPPDLDKTQRKENGTINCTITGDQYKDLHIVRKSGGEYFRNVRMFEERDEDFKNYMYQLFASDNHDARYKTIKEYIRSFEHDPDIRNNYSLHIKPIKTDQNNDLIVNGLTMQSSDAVDINDYFTTAIIKLPYRISRQNFTAVTYDGSDTDKRDYDFLLPFKPEVLSLFDGKEIDSSLHINRSSVTITLHYNGKDYQKEYATEPFKGNMGRIIDLKVAKQNLDMGLFPNILSCKETENNYFKVMVVATDEDEEAKTFNVDNVQLSFYKNDNSTLTPIREMNPDTTGANFCVRPATVRSKTDAADCGTKFYELYNTSFDVIKVEIPNGSGLLMPVWKKSRPSADAFTYAIDLGTSNTFMSRCKTGTSNQPGMLVMDAPMVSYLHETPEDAQLSLAKRIENSVFPKARKNVKTEFLPAIIDGKDYKFPIRTALCGVRCNTADIKLFDNHNIAFFYEKLIQNDDQNIRTDIKWSENEELLRVFIRELLLIIKCDILEHNGDLAQTRLVWFRPLSFMGTTKATYEEVWREEAQNILSMSPGNIKCFSESEAPYYYFKKKDLIKDSDAVTVIDIGGGSTDFVYFKDNNPVMANSIHFGCDVLWENGYVTFDDAKDNGIYNHYKDTLHFRNNDLETINEGFKIEKEVKTKDIINFWLSNEEDCGIRKLLNKDFKAVFVYHLTAILYYMASMYKDNGCEAPKTVVFSGNGSKYIDDFICPDIRVLRKITNLIFKKVFGGEHDVNLELPEERKESTCYGGLYRDPDTDDVQEKVYQGDASQDYKTVGDIDKHLDSLRNTLKEKYSEMNKLYKEVLYLLKQQQILDSTADTTKYVKKAKEDMTTPFNTYYKTQVKERFSGETTLHDSVFFIPIIDRIFEMTKI